LCKQRLSYVNQGSTGAHDACPASELTGLSIFRSEVLPTLHYLPRVHLFLLHLLGEQVGEQADNVGYLVEAVIEEKNRILATDMSILIWITWFSTLPDYIRMILVVLQ